ncbi:MAG TPA: hypothetical protein VIN40_09795 [Candidatus Tyrphobacter sp.]
MKTLLMALSAAALFLTSAPMIALADHPLTIINNADQGIEYINISPVDSNQWGDDWLGSDQVLEPGQRITFTIQSGCDQDIRVTFMDHHQVEKRNFDTCRYDLRVNY